MIETAVIMAAGKGTRFGARTTAMPKGFIEFKGKAMIERSIENLLSVGIKKIIIGTGYHREWYEDLKKQYPQIETVFSPLYAESNSMETLYQCRHAVGDNDFLLLESDLVYEPKALQILFEDSHQDIMLASGVTKFQDQYFLAVDDDKNLLGCSTDKEKLMEKFGKEPYGELVGIHKISNRFYKKIIEDYSLNRNYYLKRGYEYEIEDVGSPLLNEGVKNEGDANYITIQTNNTTPVFVLKPENLQWYEIDDEKDLNYAEQYIML